MSVLERLRELAFHHWCLQLLVAWSPLLQQFLGSLLQCWLRSAALITANAYSGCDVNFNTRFMMQTHYAPTNMLPHHPLGCKWGFTRGIDMKLLPHYGGQSFIKHPSIFSMLCQIQSKSHVATGTNGWGFDTIGLPYHGAFNIQLCPL